MTRCDAGTSRRRVFFGCLRQPPQAAILTFAVDECHRPRLVLQQFHQLRSRAAQSLGRGFHVHLPCRDDVQGFRQQRGKIAVLRVDHELPVPTTATPQIARFVVRRHGTAMLDCETDSQPERGLLLVFGQAPAFVRLSGNSRRTVRDDGRRFDLIAMLPSRTGTARAPRVALFEQLSDGQRGRMGICGHCKNRR